jgi:hypothetical protein
MAEQCGSTGHLFRRDDSVENYPLIEGDEDCTFAFYLARVQSFFDPLIRL